MNREAIEYYKSISTIMENFCRPLNDYLGVSLFIYFKAFGDGSYVILTNDIEASKEYCTKMNTDNLSTYFENYIGIKSSRKIFLWPTTPTDPGTTIFYNRDYWHGLCIVNLNENFMEGYTFLGYKDTPQVRQLFFKNSIILEKFIEHFKVSFTDILSKSEQCKAKFKSNYNFYLPQYQVQNIPNIDSFIEATDMNKGILDTKGNFIYLTPKEKQCLALINKGYSLKGIGKELLLSPRTIEVHLNNVKNKTGYHTKNNLIRVYRDFF